MAIFIPICDAVCQSRPTGCLCGYLCKVAPYWCILGYVPLVNHLRELWITRTQNGNEHLSDSGKHSIRARDVCCVTRATTLSKVLVDHNAVLTRAPLQSKWNVNWVLCYSDLSKTVKVGIFTHELNDRSSHCSGNIHNGAINATSTELWDMIIDIANSDCDSSCV